jgi:hypothetical protein
MLMRAKVQYRGRWLVIGWTLVFLAVTGAIVVRQTRGFRAQQALSDLSRTRNQLQERSADLESRISSLKNRSNLGPKVAAFGLRTPSDSESVTLRFNRAP